MNNFPLYDNIISKDVIPNKKIYKKDMVQLAKQLNKITEEKNIVYIIIKYHQIKNENNNFELPYKCCIKNKRDLEFDITNFPSELVQILMNYMKLITK